MPSRRACCQKGPLRVFHALNLQPQFPTVQFLLPSPPHEMGSSPITIFLSPPHNHCWLPPQWGPGQPGQRCWESWGWACAHSVLGQCKVEAVLPWFGSRNHAEVEVANIIGRLVLWPGSVDLVRGLGGLTSLSCTKAPDFYFALDPANSAASPS